MVQPIGPEADCLCGHGTKAHRAKVFNNRVYPFCVRCPECTGFGIIRPVIPRALLLEGEELDEEEMTDVNG